jgi:hypothetical protein
MRWLARTPCLLLLALLAAGCQRLNYDETVTIPTHSVKAVLFSAPKYAQKVTVTITPKGGAVNAYLVKDPDGKYEDPNPTSKPKADEILAEKETDKAEAFTFEANIPAKTAYTLLLYTEKDKAEVRVQVVGR